jgi:predicted CoA-substrate-specific enzyme activase
MGRGEDLSLYLGIDIGSISIKVMVLDSSRQVVLDHYQRFRGQPLLVLYECLEKLFTHRISPEQIVNIGITGSGSHRLGELLRKDLLNEVIAQAWGTALFHPEVKTIIEMGGEDSKLILLESDPFSDYPIIKDFSMNTICAAGTGSFLDQQALRLGLNIEGEFGAQALKSTHPPRIAGRCSVFAKSDMIHLQQIGTPTADIVAGLCYAVARNIKSTLGKGKKLDKPIAFLGGVAANAGMVKAFEEVLGLKPGELIIPKYFATLGAAGAALLSMTEEEKIDPTLWDLSRLKELLSPQKMEIKTYYSLSHTGYSETKTLLSKQGRINKEQRKVYLGIDVGSLSTNVVAIDEAKEVVARRYLKTAGKPLEMVKQGLKEIGEEIGSEVEVLGVGTTGSGRYLTAQYVGADIIKNEITAQATAAIHIDPGVDTIFEIGGQDSKYISLDRGVIVDFEMNKVCAAGTGSFLEEQAERLGIDIVDQFGSLALAAKNPCRLGDRCTVFMESDLVANQCKGADLEGLVAGLSYSIVYNYLHRVVGDRRIGNKIFFQGGVASNQGVVAAFSKVLGKDIIVPPHHDVTGAIGAAILAKEVGPGGPSRFKGFDLSQRYYQIEKFHCAACENQCEINKVRFGQERPQFYGARCERYEVGDKKKLGESLPNLFQERENLLLFPSIPLTKRGKSWKIGIPRILHFHEFFPFWQAFFSYLGCETFLSLVTNQKTINFATENCTAETCFPIKIAFGHIMNLQEQELDFIFLPSLLQYPDFGEGYLPTKRQTCPYIPALPYMVASFLRHQYQAPKVKLLQPQLNFGWGRKHWQKALIEMGRELERTSSEVKKAIEAALKAQQAFYTALKDRGQKALASINDLDKAFVLVSRPYNGCDPGINLGIVNKLKNLGILTLPLDYFLAQEPPGLPAHEATDPNVYWHYGQRIMQAARYIKQWKERGKIFYPLYLTNFSCGPDSFLIGFFKKELVDHPLLLIELDEHSADAGLVTRCEAFLDSINQIWTKAKTSKRDSVTSPGSQQIPVPEIISKSASSFPQHIFIPYMGDGSYALEAAFKAHDIEAQVLPVSDEESLELGKEYAIGKECLPFILTLGDFLKKLREGDFNPDKCAFFMPTSEGPCRFGLYFQRHKQIFQQLGYGNISFISPNQGNTNGYYNELAKLPPGFSRTGWQAIVAFESLEKLHRAYRPYALDKEQIERVYQAALKTLFNAIIEGRIESALQEIITQYNRIPRDNKIKKPIIGIVGEIYLRTHPFSNNYLTEKIERLGGEVWLATTQEWVMFVSHWLQRDSWERGDYRGFLRAYLKKYFQTRDETKIFRLFKRHTPSISIEEPDTDLILKYSDRYLDHNCGTEAVLSLGRATDFVLQGASGIISVMPFTCMPGTIAGALLRQVQEDFHNIPCISLAFDGLEDTQLQARLEAFMYQAHQYQKRREIINKQN